MTAVETIQAAIDKLQRQRDSYYSEGEEVWRAEHRDSDASRIFNQDDLMIAADVSALDADLIVTLHRTIEPQLAILRSGHANEPYDDQIIPVYALTLARAILGGDAA